MTVPLGVLCRLTFAAKLDSASWAIFPVDLAGDLSTKRDVGKYVDTTVLYVCSNHVCSHYIFVTTVLIVFISISTLNRVLVTTI